MAEAQDTDKTGKSSGAAGVDRLRDRIDRGGTGDKVAFSDPAAAPLGTDDEASGHPPDMAQVRYAERQETARDRAAEGKPTPAERQGPVAGRVWLLLVAAAIAAGVVLALLV